MRTLPDILRKSMKLVIVGYNPAERSVRVGHYYAGRDHPFWPLLYDAKIVPEPLECADDVRLPQFGIGLTDLVKRPTSAAGEIAREEVAEGRVLLAKKLEEFTPRVVAFHGKLTYEHFFGRPCKLGLQKERLYGARVFVLPATSGPKASLGRAQRLRLFRQLARLLKRVE